MAKGFFPPKKTDDLGLEKNSPEPNINTSSDSSNMSAIRSGLTLPLQQMAIPIYTAPSQYDVEVGGRVLFQNFIHEELIHQGLPEDAIEVENPPPDVFGDAGPDVDAEFALPERAVSPALVGTPDGYSTQNFITLGGNIREIADQFAVSHQRRLIREQADQLNDLVIALLGSPLDHFVFPRFSSNNFVRPKIEFLDVVHHINVDLGSISHSTFSHMLQELFRNGIDKYCIVALFYFCSDVLIRCIKKELHQLGSRLFFWALDFLIKHVCKWVYNHGGWERVFSKFYNVAMKASAAVALGVIIVCGIIFIRKNL